MVNRVVSMLWSLNLTVVTLAAAAFYAAGASIRDWRFDAPVFLAILGVFALNLAMCTVRRLVFRRHARATDYLPDLAHVSLLILIVGGAGSLVGRREEAVTLTVGEGFLLESRYELVLEETVDSGINWESTFRVTDAGADTGTDIGTDAGADTGTDIGTNAGADTGTDIGTDIGTNAKTGTRSSSGTSADHEHSATTRVNSPLRLGRSTLYQTGWEIAPVITLVGPDGGTVRLSTGEGFSVGERTFVFEETGAGNGAEVVATELRGADTVQRTPVAAGDQFGTLRVVAIERMPRTTITVVQDPGVVPAAVGGVLLTISMTWFILARAFRKGDTG